MHKTKIILALILITTKFMGQITLSQTNGGFETYVNDIVKQNIGKPVVFEFFADEYGKNKKTEIIRVNWEEENVIVVSQASSQDGPGLEDLRIGRYKYVDGYFSDLVKEGGDYIEVTKTAPIGLVLKGFRDGKLAVENRILLDENKETVFSDHFNYYGGSEVNPARTQTSYSKKVVDQVTTISTQESYDIVDGEKKMKYKLEITTISSFDEKTKIKKLTCTAWMTYHFGSEPEVDWTLYETYNSAGKIIKVEFPGDVVMTVTYN